MNINWTSEESYIFLNPRASYFNNINFNDIINKFNLKSHIILATSGSTALNPTEAKFVALKKSAILASSNSVNEHLICTQKDVILNPLPYFHIGGLSTFSRAYLSGAKLVNYFSENIKWNPEIFIHELKQNEVTITSLVPTQVFDIVNLNLIAPKKLRAAVVGGGALSFKLFEKACKLGWPLLPSYGMTECCSQIATAPLNFNWNSTYPNLKILNHLNVVINSQGKICVAGSSLLTGYIVNKNDEFHFLDIKSSIDERINDNNQFIVTSDIGAVFDGTLNIYGRVDDVVKIAGESVSLNRLDNILTDIKSEFDITNDIVVIAEQDSRLENKISIVFLIDEFNNNDIKNKVVLEFNNRVLPFEKVKNIYNVKSIPKTDLGKIKRAQLVNELFLNQ